MPEGQEPGLTEAHSGQLAQAIPTIDATTMPTAWSGDRFDVIWTFGLDPAAGRYAFGQVPQQLLEGEANTVI